jgi:hypothetical protein
MMITVKPMYAPGDIIPAIPSFTFGPSERELREALVEAACILENREIPMPVALAHAEVIRTLLAKREVVSNV